MRALDWVLLGLCCAAMYVACFSFWVAAKTADRVNTIAEPDFGTIAELESRIAGMEKWRVSAIDAQFSRDLAQTPLRKRTGV